MGRGDGETRRRIQQSRFLNPFTVWILREAGIATAEEVDIDSLAGRLRAETVAAGGVVKTPDPVSAWTRKP